MPRHAKILLVTWDGAGNLPPQRALVRALVARGHAVHALAHDAVRDMLEADGATFLPLRGVRQHDSKVAIPPDEEMPFFAEHIFFEKAFGVELLEAVEQVRPGLLLVDFCLSQSLAAALGSGLPTAVFCHFPYQFMVGPLAPFFAAGLEGVNAHARELGCGPFVSHQQLMESAPLLIVSSYLGFDPVEAPAAKVIHVGPCRTPGISDKSWQRQSPEKPLVLVGLSTSNQGQLPLLQRICDALGRLDIEAVVTTGYAIAPESLNAAGNTTLLRFAAHDEVLPAADLLITHAGHGTVMAGMTHGVPMLCLPMVRDQPLVAQRVAALGLGAVASPEASVDEIGQAITAMLADKEIRQRARAFSRSLVDHPGLDRAVELVEGLLR